MHTASVYFGFDFQDMAYKIVSRDLSDDKEKCKNFICCLAAQIKKDLQATCPF